MFDKNLAEYAVSLFNRDGIKIKTQHNIESLSPGLPGSSDVAQDVGCLTLKTKQEGEIGIGMCVWSTGLMMNPFIQHALDDVHTYPTSSATLTRSPSTAPEAEKWALKRHARSGGLLVDDHFRVKLIPKAHCNPSACPTTLSAEDKAKIPEAVMQDVFALGDVTVLESGRLPATAQVANQEAKWLGKALNKGLDRGDGFTFKNLGVMTYLGNMKAIMQTDGHTEIKGYVCS
jgi:NADH dehydrogenase FAD-containing subunit